MDPNRKINTIASNLVFCSIIIGMINTWYSFKDFLHGNMNGAGLIILIIFAGIALSFIIAILCAILIRTGIAAGSYLFFAYFFISIIILSFQVGTSGLEYWFYLLKTLQLALQIWAMVLLVKKNTKAQGRKI